MSESMGMVKEKDRQQRFYYCLKSLKKNGLKLEFSIDYCYLVTDRENG